MSTVLSATAASWLSDARELIATDPTQIHRLFARAQRDCGEHDAMLAREELLQDVPSAAPQLYYEGDALERIAVLRTLHLIDVPAVPLIHDALRCNDLRIIEASMGPRSIEVDDHTFRRAVLKFAYLDLPLSSVHAIDRRMDTELRNMLRQLCRERTSAGRSVPARIYDYI